MKKEYKDPELKVLELEQKDILTTSAGENVNTETEEDGPF